MTTEQEEFWRGDFGDEYVIRNDIDSIGSRINLWSKIFSRTGHLSSVYEVGTNIGLNLDAMKSLISNLQAHGCEINQSAHARVVEKGHDVENASVFEAEPKDQFDLVFTSGVLIHINPDRLKDVYDFMVRTSRRYIVVNEYYSPSPVEIKYRGHAEKLFKRDFAQELIQAHDLSVVDYGFTWRNDPIFPLDDANWFLLEKK